MIGAADDADGITFTLEGFVIVRANVDDVHAVIAVRAPEEVILMSADGLGQAIARAEEIDGGSDS